MIFRIFKNTNPPQDQRNKLANIIEKEAFTLSRTRLASRIKKWVTANIERSSS